MSFKMIDTFTWVGVAGVEDHLGPLPQNPGSWSDMTVTSLTDNTATWWIFWPSTSAALQQYPQQAAPGTHLSFSLFLSACVERFAISSRQAVRKLHHEGLTREFRIGFNYSGVPSRQSEHDFARESASAVDAYLHEEMAQGRVIELAATKSSQPVWGNPQTSPSEQVVTDRRPIFLSGASVNDGVDGQSCSWIEDATRSVVQLGQGSLLAKIDLQRANRFVHPLPDDQHLLGMQWRKVAVVWIQLSHLACALPPNLFSCGRCAVVGHVRWGVTSCIQYLDHFLFFGPPGSDASSHNLQVSGAGDVRTSS